MPISNIILTPRARSRTYDIRLHIKRAAKKMSNKVTNIYYGNTRTPFPTQTLSRLLEATFIRRLDLRPGHPSIAYFDNAVSNGGFPSPISHFYALAPSGFIHRISDEQTVIYSVRRGHENYMYTYMGSPRLLADLDVLRAWYIANKHANHMLSHYRVDKIAKYFNFTLVNRSVFNSGNVELALNTREIRPSVSMLGLFLFSPTVLNNVQDYDVANNIKFDATITLQTFEAATDDLLNWFFFGGHSVPKVGSEPTVPPTPPVVQDLGNAPDTAAQPGQQRTGRSNNDVSKPRMEGRGSRPSPRNIDASILATLDIINKQIKSREIKSEFIRALALLTV